MTMSERSAELARGWIEAWIRMDMEWLRANGVVDSCDWIRVEDGRIREIRSFYDSAKLRELLSPSDQERLDGSDS